MDLEKNNQPNEAISSEGYQVSKKFYRFDFLWADLSILGSVLYLGANLYVLISMLGIAIGFIHVDVSASIMIPLVPIAIWVYGGLFIVLPAAFFSGIARKHLFKAKDLQIQPYNFENRLYLRLRVARKIINISLISIAVTVVLLLIIMFSRY